MSYILDIIINDHYTETLFEHFKFIELEALEKLWMQVIYINACNESASLYIYRHSQAVQYSKLYKYKFFYANS